MARIRTVKPELWQDESLAKVSRDARLLFVGLFNVADDEGRMRGAPAFIAGQVFPYDEDLSVKDLLNELEAGRFIQRYEASEQRFIFITNFRKHQKIDHPTPSKFPKPPEPVSREIRESIASASLKIVQEQGTGNREGKGKELKASDAIAPVPVLLVPERQLLAVQIPAPWAEPEKQAKKQKPERSPKEVACRAALADAFEAEYETRTDGGEFRWGAADRVGIANLSTASGNDSVRALSLLAEFVRRSVSDVYFGKNFRPAFIGADAQINALRMPAPVAGAQPHSVNERAKAQIRKTDDLLAKMRAIPPKPKEGTT